MSPKKTEVATNTERALKRLRLRGSWSLASAAAIGANSRVYLPFATRLETTPLPVKPIPSNLIAATEVRSALRNHIHPGLGFVGRSLRIAKRPARLKDIG